MAFIGNAAAAPAYWDELDDAKRQQLRDFESSSEFKNYLAIPAEGNLYTDNVEGNLRYNLKKNGDYFYGPATLLKDSGNRKAGNVFAGCYFFKKVN
jgi:hypothetical protein